MIVLDATVLIAYLDERDAHHERAVTLLSREIDDDFAVSALTLAEVLVDPAGAGRLDAALSALADLDVAEQLFPHDTAIRLAELRASTRLRMPNCCVLLAAQHAGARIASFDKPLANAATRLAIATVTS